MATVLLRSLPNEDENERNALMANFKVLESRMDIPPNELVIARYSCLPFYEELERDLKKIDSRLINSYKQHRYIADLMTWYQDLEGLTPRSYPSLELAKGDGPFVLKGNTNSRKFQWDTHMFAANRRAAAEISVELKNDSLIGYQDIVVRDYVPLKTYMYGLHELPITKEFRFFIAYGKVLSGGYYWSSYVEDLEEVPTIEEVPADLLVEVISRVDTQANFYTVDVAQTEGGNWIVIELNDGQMSGLSENDPEVLYRNLKIVLDLESKRR